MSSQIAGDAPMIRARGLAKAYDRLIAVDHIDLEVAPGEVFGFLGPNGAGKTTTIRMLVGMMKPTAGTVEIDGIDIAKNHLEAKSRIGFVPDRPYIYEKLTAMEFLHFVGGLFRMNAGDIEKRGAELLELFTIDHVANELVAGFSHGMRQRLIMASAFLHRPKLIVVDEPMVGLDPRGMKLVKNLFREQARTGTTIFMSTHTLDIVEEVCDRVAIIHNGRIIATGTMDELRSEAGHSARLEEIFLRLTDTEDMPDVAGVVNG